MDTNISNIIKRVYVEKDFSFFREQCARVINSLELLLGAGEQMCSDVDYYSIENNPSIEITYIYKEHKNNDTNIQFKTVLQISKIADIFTIQHEFSMDNPVPSRVSPVLDGFGEEAYINEQYNLQEILLDKLEKMNYKIISTRGLSEVVTDVKMPDNNFFGSQMTVESALFRDIWGILEDK